MERAGYVANLRRIPAADAQMGGGVVGVVVGGGVVVGVVVEVVVGGEGRSCGWLEVSCGWR